MLFRTTVVPVLASAVFIAVPCSAQNMKAGLWEINNTIKSGDGQLEQAMAMLQEHIAQMSPEQRKSMEGMMARNGFDMPTPGANGAMVVKMCMTKDMVARNEVPFQQDGNCTHTKSPVKGNMMKLSFSCTRPAASGEGQVTFLSDRAYGMRMRVTSNMGDIPQTMNMEAAGKWLGADCGNITPKAVPKAK